MGKPIYHDVSRIVSMLFIADVRGGGAWRLNARRFVGTIFPLLKSDPPMVISGAATTRLLRK